MCHLLTTKRYIVYLTFDRFLSFFIVAGNDILQLNIGSSFFLAGQQIDRLQKSQDRDQSNNCVLLTIIWSPG